MYCSIITWNLSRSDQTVASLREYLRDYAVEAYAEVDGLHQKVWISSDGPDGEVWGAVYLWETWEAAYGRRPEISKLKDLIGYRPTERSYFSVEAATDGAAALAALGAGLGLAYENPEEAPVRRPEEFTPPGWS